MRTRWVTAVLACGIGVSALVLGGLLPAADAARDVRPGIYKGKTATGGTVELTISPDGSRVTRFHVTRVTDTCGKPFSGTVDMAVPIVGVAFSNGRPSTGLAFSGSFTKPGRAEGTASYRVVNVRDDGCRPRAVRWTATRSSRPGVLVSYRQDGGLGGPRPSLGVFEDRSATVTLGRCTETFALRRGAWKRLRSALRSADLPATAGDYLPPAPIPDAIAHVIEADGDTVRIVVPAQPEHQDVMDRLEPLLRQLNRTVSAGVRRMAPSCKSSRRV